MSVKRSDFPWFPFWARDFTDSRLVRTSDPEVVGVYTLLLCEQWKDGPLPDDTEAMATLCGVPHDVMEKAWEKLRSRYKKTEEGWVNERLNDVWKEKKAKREQQIAAGRKGARARYESHGSDGDRNRDPSGDPKGSPKGRHSDPNGSGMAKTESDTETEQEEEPPSVVNTTPSGAERVREVLWPVFLEELGGDGRQPKLTPKRKKKLRLLDEEQLPDEPDEAAEEFRAILRAVQASDHHMSERDYQMPESLFRNAERRDRWAAKAGEEPGVNGARGFDGGAFGGGMFAQPGEIA